MKVALIAQDIAPSSAFEMLAVELMIRGHEPVSLLGKGKVFPATLGEVRKAVRDSDIVVVGMSSSAKFAEPEIEACVSAILQTLSKKKIPFGFYGDTYHCYERARADAWFGPYRRHADFFFAINEEEARVAKNVLVKPTLVSVATGNPIWEDYAFPKYTRAEVRAKYGVSDEELLVLSPFIKSPVINILNCGMLIEALVALQRKFRIIAAFHPGDSTPAEIYEGLKDSSVAVGFLDRNVKVSDVLSGVDIVATWNSSSITIEAAHQRIPVIGISTDLGRRRTFSESNTEKWEPCELGISEEVRDVKELRFMLEELVGDSVIRQNLLETQARVYPKPQAKGSAVKKMADTLESILKS